MKKIVILLVILVMGFTFTIPASAGRFGSGSGIGPGDGTGPIYGLGPIRGNNSGGNGFSIGPGDGTGPIYGLGPVRGKNSGGNGFRIGPGDGTGPIYGLGPIRGNFSSGNGFRSGLAGGTSPVGDLRQQGSHGIFVIVGKIVALGTNTVSIDVLRGNKLVQPILGTQVSVTVTANTRYLYKDGTTIVTIAFADLEVGQQVSVNGLFANDVWTADRITVGALLSCLP